MKKPTLLAAVPAMVLTASMPVLAQTGDVVLRMRNRAALFGQEGLFKGPPEP